MYFQTIPVEKIKILLYTLVVFICEILLYVTVELPSTVRLLFTSVHVAQCRLANSYLWASCLGCFGSLQLTNVCHTVFNCTFTHLPLTLLNPNHITNSYPISLLYNIWDIPFLKYLAHLCLLLSIHTQSNFRGCCIC